MQKIKKLLMDESSGEVMLESTIVMLITLMLIIAMISLGFLFYQRAMLSYVANDIASEIAASYKEVKVQTDDNGNQDAANQLMYRSSFRISSIARAKKEIAEEMLKEKLPLVSLGVGNDAEIADFNAVTDNIGRMHVEVTAKAKCNILFGEALVYFGILDDMPEFTAVGSAQCLDLTAYAGYVNFWKYVGGKSEGGFIANHLSHDEKMVATAKELIGNVGDLVESVLPN